MSEWSDYDEARPIHKIQNETRASIKHMLVDFDQPQEDLIYESPLLKSGLLVPLPKFSVFPFSQRWQLEHFSWLANNQTLDAFKWHANFSY